MALTQVSRGLLSTSIVDNGNATAITIDSSENVGVGTSSPSSVLTAVSGDSADETVLTVGNDYSTADAAGDASGLMFQLYRSYSPGLNDAGFIKAEKEQAWDSSGDRDSALTFGTRSGGTEPTERMRIDSSGKVGIGTSNLHGKFQVSSGGAQGIEFFPASTSTQNSTQHYNRSGSAYVTNKIIALDHRFDVSGSEAMRIDSSGNLLVGDSSVASASNSACTINSGGRIDTSRAATNLQTHHQFFNPNGVVGTITTNGSATAYNTSSDQRLKENIVDAPSASDDIDAIQVRSFDWKADGSHQKYGMVAQELQSVAPEAVSGDADSDDMMGVDYSKLVPMMLKEIQSLRSRVQQLEN